MASNEIVLLLVLASTKAIVSVSPNLLLVLLNCISPWRAYDNNVRALVRCFANGDCDNDYDDDDRTASQQCEKGRQLRRH